MLQSREDSGKVHGAASLNGLAAGGLAHHNFSDIKRVDSVFAVLMLQRVKLCSKGLLDR